MTEHIEHDGVPVELDLSPAAERPPYEWPGELELPTVSCRNCQAECHWLGGGQFGEAPDAPLVSGASSVFCAGTHKPHEPQWSTEQMRRDFEVKGFSMCICVARRRADGKLGSLDFDHMPRFYFGWQPHES